MSTNPFNRLRLICGWGEVQQYPGLASAFPCAHHAAGGGDGLNAIKATRQAILEHAIRITFVEQFQRYIMTYTALSPQGPRIALALSADLFHWQRLGLATFGRYRGVEIGDLDDKDASVFPVAIPNPSGHLELAMLHRPIFPGTRPEETACHPSTREVDLDRESIWISYCPMALKAAPWERAALP